MAISNPNIDEAIDNAVLACYPAYADAANIAGMMADFVIGTAAYLDTYGRHQVAGLKWNPSVTEEFTGFALMEAAELSHLATLITKGISSSTDEAKGIILAEFQRDWRAYHNSVRSLMNFLSASPEYISIE